MANSTIKFPQEMPPAAAINGDDKIMIADAVTNEAKSASFDSAKQYLNITGIELKPVPAGALPAGPADQERKMQITEAGTWTFGGSSFVNPEDSVMILWWNGSTWSIADQYVLPVVQGTDVLNPVGGLVPKESAVAEYFAPAVSMADKLPFTLLSGRIRENGTVESSLNWIHAKSDVTEQTDYYISGYGLGGSSYELLSTQRVNFFNNNSFLGSVSSVGFDSGFPFQTPVGCNNIKVQLDAGVNVGADLGNSKYLKDYVLNKGTELSKSIINAEFISGDILTPQISMIEENIEDLLKKGNQVSYKNGAPLFFDGVDGNLVIDTSSGLMYQKNGNKWIGGIPLGGQKRKFKYPEGFSWIDINIYKLTSSNVYIPEVTNVSDLVIDDLLTKTKYYVDPVGGSDLNDGLSRTSAFKNCQKAIDVGASFVVLMDGFYNRDQSIPRVIYTNNVAWVADQGATPVMTSWDAASRFTWSADENIYYTTRSAVFNVLDTDRYLSDKEGYFMYSKVASVAICKTTAYSFYTDGSVVYINTNNVQPAANIKLCLQQFNCEFVLGANIDYIYLEGIVSYVNSPRGGIAILNSTSVQYNGTAIMKACSAYGNRQGNSISINNTKKCYIQDSGGAKCLRDALNYHTSMLPSGYELMKSVEINGWSYDTGWEAPAEGSSNGSTAHEGMSIIRFGGKFDKARGSVVVDVNEGMQSLNFNTEASGSYLASTASFQVQDGKMWLYGCYANESTYAAKADGTLEDPTVFYDNETLLDGNNSGNVIPLT